MTTLEADSILVPSATRDPLYPLSEFLDPRPSWNLELLDGGAVPEPQHTLLVHDRDMTSTLENHYGESLGLRIIARRVDGERLDREVVLVGKTSRRTVEFGAIRIHLGAFPAAARPAILAGRRPLGALLAEFQIPFVSRPRLFFRLQPSRQIESALEINAVTELFGRQNVLRAPDGRALADVVEILPPAAD